MSPKRDLSGFAATGGLPTPPPPPVVVPADPADEPEASPPPAVAGAPAVRASRRAAPSAKVAVEKPAPRAARTKMAQPPEPVSAIAPEVNLRGRAGRRRICVTLSLETNELLNVLCSERGCWKVELIIAALHRWEGSLRSTANVDAPSRFRRRRGSTPTPFVMDLTDEELRRLDALAAAVGQSRSALVRRLIQLDADNDPAAAL